MIKRFNAVLALAEKQGRTSGEHFSVVGTLIEAWAGYKSFQRKDGSDDKGYDAQECMTALIELDVIPHVAQNTGHRRSAVPDFGYLW